MFIPLSLVTCKHTESWSFVAGRFYGTAFFRLARFTRLASRLLCQGSVRDKLTPLVAEVHYSLVTRKPGQGRGELWPVLNLDTPPLATDVLAIQKNCGGDDVCVPDLQITARP